VSEPLTVVQALSAVRADLPGIGKDDRNTQEGFNFRSSETINRVLSPVLAKHGVVLVPKSTVREVVASPAMKDGWQDVYLTIDWTIYGPDGSSITARTNGVGRDKVDRGANKAATQAYKYLVLQLFGIADKDDDSDGLSYEHDRVENTLTPSQAVHARLKAIDPASATAEELGRLKTQHGKQLTETALRDNTWRAVVEGVLNNATLAEVADEPVEAEQTVLPVDAGRVPLGSAAKEPT
jgi:hypothetical protein